ncbi:MAG: hypothetical protein LUQ57_04480 [Methylococcaceae bacterium]|nr:hypothetical protein [Methylococcaceae bacterium]
MIQSCDNTLLESFGELDRKSNFLEASALKQALTRQGFGGQSISEYFATNYLY